MYANQLNSLLGQSSLLDYMMAEITLIKLAPWIMLLLAFWALGRLFRSGESVDKSDTQDKQDGDEPYEYEDDEIEDDYDEYDQEE